MAYSGKIRLWSVDYELDAAHPSDSADHRDQWFPARRWFTTEGAAAVFVKAQRRRECSLGHTRHECAEPQVYELPLSQAGVQWLLDSVAYMPLPPPAPHIQGPAQPRRCSRCK